MRFHAEKKPVTETILSKTSPGSPLVARVLLSLLAQSVVGLASWAQIPEPPDRAKDNKHKSSAGQDEKIEVLEAAWARCIAIHLTDNDEDDVRRHIDSSLQNQYPEWAAYHFWQEMAELVADDLNIVSGVRDRSPIGPGALADHTDEILRRAVISSGGALCCSEVTGEGGSLRGLVDRVTKNDPRTMEKLRRVSAKPEKDWARAARDLGKRYASALIEALPMGGSKNANDFRSQVDEMIVYRSTRDAVQGIQNKLRTAVREHVKGSRTLGSVQAYLALENDVDAFLSKRVPEEFWQQLQRDHAQLLEDPVAHRKALAEASAPRIPPPAGDGEGEGGEDDPESVSLSAWTPGSRWTDSDGTIWTVDARTDDRLTIRRPSEKQSGHLLFELAVDGTRLELKALTYETPIKIQTRNVGGRGVIGSRSLEFEFLSEIRNPRVRNADWKTFKGTVTLTPAKAPEED